MAISIIFEVQRGIDGIFDKYIVINLVPKPVRYLLCATMFLGPCVLMVAVMCCGEYDEEPAEAEKNDEQKAKDDKQKKSAKKVEREKID